MFNCDNSIFFIISRTEKEEEIREEKKVHHQTQIKNDNIPYFEKTKRGMNTITIRCTTVAKLFFVARKDEKFWTAAENFLKLEQSNVYFQNLQSWKKRREFFTLDFSP